MNRPGQLPKESQRKNVTHQPWWPFAVRRVPYQKKWTTATILAELRGSSSPIHLPPLVWLKHLLLSEQSLRRTQAHQPPTPALQYYILPLPTTPFNRNWGLLQGHLRPNKIFMLDLWYAAWGMQKINPGLANKWCYWIVVWFWVSLILICSS